MINKLNKIKWREIKGKFVLIVRILFDVKPIDEGSLSYVLETFEKENGFEIVYRGKGETDWKNLHKEPYGLKRAFLNRNEIYELQGEYKGNTLIVPCWVIRHSAYIKIFIVLIILFLMRIGWELLVLLRVNGFIV